MSDVDRLEADALKVQQKIDAENAVIDANKSKTKADFEQFNGLALNDLFDPSFDTLYIDADSYDGSANNSLAISLNGDGSSPGDEWTTVESIARAGQIAYQATYKDFEVPPNVISPPGTIAGSSAYEILRKLNVHKLLAV